MHKKTNNSYPWQSPLRCLLLFAALCFALFLTLNMPHKEFAVHAGTQITQSEQAKLNNAKIYLENQQIIQENSKLDKSISKARKEHKKSSPLKKILAKLKTIGRVFLMVGIAGFFGALMEARQWYRCLGKSLIKITQKARLPEIIGLAMPIALYSSVGANSMLAASHEKSEISTSALITGGMANSYLTHFSHSVRVMYPVIALIGIAGVGFFTIQLLGGFLLICGCFIVHWYISKQKEQEEQDLSHLKLKQKEPLAWKASIKQSLLRSLAILFRLGYITVPLMLGTEWILKSGMLDFWEEAVPYQVAKFFPAELIAIVIAQIGGLIQSAGVSSHFLAENMVNHAQILLAMLIASAIGNPIRTLRRNLPIALGIFPVKVALTIVLSMQFARFLITVLGSALVVLYLYYTM